MFTTILLTILLFLVPITLIAVKDYSTKSLKLKKLVIILDKAFLIQIASGLILYLIVNFLPYFNDKYESNNITDTIIETMIYFITIGIFYYFPCLILLNLITKSWKKIQ